MPEFDLATLTADFLLKDLASALQSRDLFLGDVPPRPPFDEPGLDPTPDNLPGCAI